MTAKSKTSKKTKTTSGTQKLTYKKRNILISKQGKITISIDDIPIQAGYDKKIKKYSSNLFPYQNFSSTIKLAKKAIDADM